MARWNYAKGDRQFGPVSGRELKQLAEQGRLLPTDLIWEEGESERRPAATAKGLFSDPTGGDRRADHAPSGLPPATDGSRAEPASASRTGISAVGVAGFFTALLSIVLGGGASYLYWTNDQRPLVLPIALLGLLLGNLVLLVDWFRKRLRLCLSVLGVTVSTVALLTAFWDAGGLEKAASDVRQAIATYQGSQPTVKPRALEAGRAITTSEGVQPSGPTQVPKSKQSLPTAAAVASLSSSGEGVRSDGMTKQELVAKIEALGVPCAREDLFKAVGRPQETRTEEGRLAGLFWTWQCQDGKVEVVLLNPEFGSGEHTDKSLAYISRINDQ
jgi:hypothetical protein